MSKNTNILNTYYIILLILWSSLFVGYYLLERRTLYNATLSMAENEANIAFMKDTLYRRWVSTHGGVYVFTNEKTVPNKYLNDIKDRDIKTSDGKTLTLINPAYMTRLVYEMADKTVVQGHLTSDKLKNPINKPDEWEKNALKAIFDGSPSYSSRDTINGEPYLRFMRPFITEEGCLKCHKSQGYKVGDIRGGISLEVPLKSYYQLLESKMGFLKMIVTIIWFAGIIGIFLTYRYLKRGILEEEAINLRLKDSEANFRRMFETLQDIILVSDMSGKIIFANESAFNKLGWSLYELKQKRIQDIFSDMEEHATADHLNDVLLGTNLNSTLPLMTCDGKLIQAQSEFWFGKWDNSECIFMLSKDMTGEMEALNKFRKIFDNNPALMAFNDMNNNHFLEINKAFTTVLGYTKEDIIGKSALEMSLFPDSEEYTKTFSEFLEKGSIRDVRLAVTAKSGEIKHGLFSADLVESGGRKFILSVMLDITELNKITEELKDINLHLNDTIEKEVEKNRSYEMMLFNQKKLADLGRLITAISHHWRQPLNVLGLYVQEICQMHADKQLTDEYIEDFERQTISIVQKMSKMIDTFRYSVSTEDNEEDFEAVRQIIDMVRLCEAEYISLGISIVLKCSCDAKSVECSTFDTYPDCVSRASLVHGLKAQFNQAIINIMDNAKDAVLKSIHEGIITGGIITIVVYVNSEQMSITIRNNGEHIPQEIADQIYSPYFTTKEEGKGTGLGLYMAKTAIEQYMGGTITFRNEDEGVAFTITLDHVTDK